MKQTDKESFEGALNEWYLKWEAFLIERSVNEKTGESFYTNKRLRSAYRGLKTNLKWLFTWYDHMELNIPNVLYIFDLLSASPLSRAMTGIFPKHPD